MEEGFRQELSEFQEGVDKIDSTEKSPSSSSEELKEQYLSVEEFVIYTSPRYYRLLFPDLKPQTKNGDLLAALQEMKRWGFLTADADWDRIKVTRKGNQYRKLVKKLLDIKALNVPQSNGFFDYRSEPGRKVIIELIQFLSAKLDFNEYFRYLTLPIFEAEKNEDWITLFQTDPQGGGDVDISSEQNRERLLSFLNKQNRKIRKQSNEIQKTFTSQTSTIQLNLTFVKKFLQNEGLNRPEPLFSHFNASEPMIFTIHERNFSVNLAELNKIKKILEEHIDLFAKDENKWLDDYFNLLKLPTKLFGFQVSEFSFGPKETDAFLNLAIEGPKIFASQFSMIRELGDLSLIVFPLNQTDSLVIYITKMDIMFYFTIKTDDFSFTGTTSTKIPYKFPDTLIVSLKRFGRPLHRSISAHEYFLTQRIQEIEQKDKEQKEIEKKQKRDGKDLRDRLLLIDERRIFQEEQRSMQEEKKGIVEELKAFKSEIQDSVGTLAQLSASLFTVCQMISQKYSLNFELSKVFCLYERGSITFNTLENGEGILTAIKIGEIDYGMELKKMLKKIEESMQEILDIPLEESPNTQ